jgi:hypothetical protein
MYTPGGAHTYGSAVRTPNLVMGPSPAVLADAQQLNVRSSWPSVDAGYKFEQYSEYTEFIYDNQTFHDRLGGTYFRGGLEYRTGGWVR